MKIVRVAAGVRGYDVVIGTALLATAGARLRDVMRGLRCLVIADDNTAALFAEPLLDSLRGAGFEASIVTVPPGESSKSLAQAGALCDEMSAEGLDRSSFVVALGGGVVGDLAGFCAAIYHRGIPHVQLPTTLLAQVDSSIGGKTGVNTRSGKNLLGAFHSPALVVADVDTLRTLPVRDLNQGFAEVIKHAVIADPTLFEMLDGFRPDRFAELVRRNVEIKARIVAQDEHDASGERAVLNFGHTIGHAIERASAYNRFLHGEAVSLGIVGACDISTRKAGLSQPERNQVVQALSAAGLPTRLPDDVQREEILRAVASDKKFESRQVRFVVADTLGSARLATDVTREDIRDAIESL